MNGWMEHPIELDTKYGLLNIEKERSRSREASKKKRNSERGKHKRAEEKK